MGGFLLHVFRAKYLGHPVDLDSDLKRNLCAGSSLTAWFWLDKWIWSLVVAGWTWCFISYVFQFEIPSSGAVLICAIVLAEFRYESLPFKSWTRAGSKHEVSAALLHEDSEPKQLSLSINGIKVLGLEKKTRGFMSSLLVLSKDSEWLSQIYFEEGAIDGSFWLYGMTIERVDKVLYAIFSISVVVGTLLWGYGHLYF